MRKIAPVLLALFALICSPYALQAQSGRSRTGGQNQSGPARNKTDRDSPVSEEERDGPQVNAGGEEVEGDVLRVETTLVTVPVNVKDRNGRYIPDLNREDFHIFEDGIEQKIPYEAVTSAFADTQSKRPRAATIASSIPTIFTLPARFIKTKVRYLTLQFSDPNTHVSGVTSFRLKDKETLTSVLNTLAQKASLMPRGEVFVKSRNQGSSQQTNP